MHAWIRRFIAVTPFVLATLVAGCAGHDDIPEAAAVDENALALAADDTRDATAHDEAEDSTSDDPLVNDGKVDDTSAEDATAAQEEETEPADADAPWADANEQQTLSFDVEPKTLHILSAKPLLHWGLHPRASNALRAVRLPAWRILQTIGNAPASAGYHARDGYANGRAYSAAVDISVRGLTYRQVRTLLGKLGANGFAGWFRRPGYDGWPRNQFPHIHAVYAACRMKAVLRAQVRDWLAGRNGLSGHGTYHFYAWPTSSKNRVRALLNKYN
jgi:hypothetical protein